MATSMTVFARFVLWAESCPSFPSAREIEAKFDVAPMTAYRWRKHYRAASRMKVHDSR